MSSSDHSEHKTFQKKLLDKAWQTNSINQPRKETTESAQNEITRMESEIANLNDAIR